MSRSDTILELKKLGFSSNSLKKLDIYVQYLLDYNKKYNLISKSTESTIWHRHILDSAQIVKFIDSTKYKSFADLGSGAGLPGLVVAIYGENKDFHVKLYEKSPMKRKFLLDTIKETSLKNVEVKGNIFDDEIVDKVILSRAFKKLDKIIKISRETIKKPHKLVILKGKNAQAEINSVSLGPEYSYKIENSITEHDSKIIIIDVKKNEK